MKDGTLEKKLKVMVADDHPVVREGLTKMLGNIARIGQVDQASNGREALELLASGGHDLVFMDIKMPVMDGLAATAAIAQRYPATKVIALSVYDDEDNVRRMFKGGAKGYLLKNTDQEEMEAAIRDVTAGKMYASKALSDAMLRRLVGDGPDEFVTLTEREQAVLNHLWQGLTSKEIAKKILMSTKSVDLCRSRLLSKMKCKNTIELLKLAVDRGLIKEHEK